MTTIITPESPDRPSWPAETPIKTAAEDYAGWAELDRSAAVWTAHIQSDDFTRAIDLAASLATLLGLEPEDPADRMQRSWDDRLYEIISDIIGRTDQDLVRDVLQADEARCSSRAHGTSALL